MKLQKKPHPQPLVSVIMPTLNGSELVAGCISSFIQTVRHVPCEWIVVDDGSGQEEREKIRNLAFLYGFKLIEMPSRNSYAKAVNAGLKVAAGKYVLLLNNDVVFQQPGWLQRMLKTAEAARNIGIVGCRLLYPDGTIQHAGGILLPGERYEHLYRGQQGDYPKARLIYDATAVTGALMLIKREVLADVGFLCEDYLLSYEDVDFCLRARRAGWRVVYCGTAAAVHDEGSTRGRHREDKPDEWYEEELRSHVTFWTRWKNYESVRPLRNLTLIFVLSKRCYLPSAQKITNLTAGLREHGCQIYLEKVDELNSAVVSSLANLKSAGNGAIFTNDEAIARELSKNRPLPLPVIRIDANRWKRPPYPQNVHIWINRASRHGGKPK